MLPALPSGKVREPMADEVSKRGRERLSRPEDGASGAVFFLPTANWRHRRQVRPLRRQSAKAT
jgi:hypothetical protein